MGPLWAEILETILPVIEGDDRAPPTNRLSLISGHDTSIIPLMASLDPDIWPNFEWPSYASMMILEVGRQTQTEDARMLFLWLIHTNRRSCLFLVVFLDRFINLLMA